MYPNDCYGYSHMSTNFDGTTVSNYTSVENLSLSRWLLKIKNGDADGDTEAHIDPSFYTPRKIIFNDPVSVVFWNDGTKTIVRRTKGEKFNKYTAFTAALAKKIFGNNTRVNAIVKSGIDQKEKDAAKKAKMAKKNS